MLHGNLILRHYKFQVILVDVRSTAQAKEKQRYKHSPYALPLAATAVV